MNIDEKEKDKLFQMVMCLSAEMSIVRDTVETSQKSLEDIDSLLSTNIRDDKDNKIKLWLDINQEKITGFTYRIPEKLHEQFKHKCIEEGYSLQEGIARLIKAYVDGEITVTQDKEL